MGTHFRTRIRSGLTVLVAAGVTGAGAVVSPVSVTAAPAPPAPGWYLNPDGEPEAPDLPTATRAATESGQPVLVGALTDGRTQHRANPDGTVTMTQYATPQRVRQDGGWVPADSGLARAGDRVAPRAAGLDLSLSAGGTGELVTVTEGGHRLGLSWPDPLPVPVLDGDTATYPEVYPGVDLRVRVGLESFQLLLVVADRKAAANPALDRIAWRVSADGLSLRAGEDGSVTVVDSAGQAVLTSPPSLMWDTPAPDGAPQTVRMPVEVSKTELAVRPDRKMLTAAETRFPVTIDPEFSKSRRDRWRPVFSERPNSHWPSGTAQPRDDLKVGQLAGWPGCGSWCGVWRSHIMFDVREMRNKLLVGAPSFHITLDHSASCGPTPVQLWQTSKITDDPITWNKMDSHWRVKLRERSANANEAGGCGSIQPDRPLEFSSGTFQTWLQHEMNRANPWFTVGLRAPNENDPHQWKRFHDNARLEATYNTRPDRPTHVAVGGDCLDRCASPAIIRSRTPTLTAQVDDDDRDRLLVRFQIIDHQRDEPLMSGFADNVPAGSTASWTVTPPLPVDTELRLRVRTKDQHGARSEWSASFHLVIDTTPPNDPTIHSDLYQHQDTGTWNGGVGIPGQFTFTPNGSTDVIFYEWRDLAGDVTRKRVATGGTWLTVTVTPTAGRLVEVLTVRTLDQAGNASEWVPYPFQVRPHPAATGYWPFDGDQGTTARAVTGGVAFDGQLHGGAGWVADGLAMCEIDPGSRGCDEERDEVACCQAVSLDGTGWLDMPSVLDTNHAAGFTVSAWVHPTDLSGDRTVLAQGGEQQAMFRLAHLAGARGGAGGWCFTVHAADRPDAASAQACARTAPQLAEWTYLVGVYDRPDGTITLHVNGGAEVPGGESTDPVPAAASWPARGSFTVGRAATEPGPAGWWRGHIDEVRAHQRVVGDPEIQQNMLGCLLSGPACPRPPQPVVDPTVYTGQIARWVNDAEDRLSDPTGVAPFGYEFEAPLGLPLPEGTPGTLMLYRCAAGQHSGDGFTSGDPRCEGQRTLGTLGLAYVAPPAGEPVVPLYRCRVTTLGLPDTGHHFDSNQPDCERDTAEPEFRLGYLAAYAHLVRYARDGDHWTATAAPGDPYEPEGVLGALSMVDRPGTHPLYACRNSTNGAFSSVDPGCEGGERLGRTGYLWTQPPDGVANSPLYRCVSDGDRFDSLEPDCEGQQRDLPDPLGYVVWEF